MLKRNVQIGQDEALRHQRYHLIDVRIGIDVVKPDPGIKLTQRSSQLKESGLNRSPIPEISPVTPINAVGTGVLRYHQELLDPGMDQSFSLTEHLTHGSTQEIPPHGWNDAKTAAMITAFGNLKVGIVPRGQLNALWRNQVSEGVMAWRQMFVHRIDDRFIGMSSCDLEHFGMS